MKTRTVCPYVLDDHLVLGLDIKWLSHLKENPVFTVRISKNKLVLESELR